MKEPHDEGLARLSAYFHSVSTLKVNRISRLNTRGFTHSCATTRKGGFTVLRRTRRKLLDPIKARHIMDLVQDGERQGIGWPMCVRRKASRSCWGHALAMKATHGGKAKNDKLDSRKIAGLLRGGLLPQAYV
jgi:hypothetical protein